MADGLAMDGIIGNLVIGPSINKKQVL